MSTLPEQFQIHDSRRDGWVLYHEGLALGREGRHSDALDSFSRALDVDPMLAIAWNNKGVAQGMLGRFEAEVRCCDRAQAPLSLGMGEQRICVRETPTVR